MFMSTTHQSCWSPVQRLLGIILPSPFPSSFRAGWLLLQKLFTNTMKINGHSSNVGSGNGEKTKSLASKHHSKHRAMDFPTVEWKGLNTASTFIHQA